MKIYRSRAHSRPAARALREIKYYETARGHILPRRLFQRLAREIAMGYAPDLRFQGATLTALQEAAEVYIVCFFEAANRMAIHAKRVTIQDKDMQMVKWFCHSAIVKGAAM